jgi:hypothetical protein
MKHAIRIVLAAAVTALLAACTNLSTEYPIGATAPDALDKRLLGAWKIVEWGKDNSKDIGYMFVVPNKNGGLHAVILAVGGEKADSGEAEFDFVPGHAGEEHFINAFHVIDNGEPLKDEPEGYLPYLYRFDAKGRLLIYDHADPGLKLLADAIDNNRLEGTVTVKTTGKDGQGNPVSSTEVHITAQADALDAFFAANAKNIFTEKMDTFERIKMP